jgi:quercetin dioxygenase-like cupin family protein
MKISEAGCRHISLDRRLLLAAGGGIAMGLARLPWERVSAAGAPLAPHGRGDMEDAMVSTPARSGIHVPADAGTELRFGPNRMFIRIGPKEGAEQLGLMSSSFVPGGGYPFLHVHYSYEEAFFVIDGEVEYQLGETKILATAGSSVFIPPGVPHRFKGVGADSARIIVLLSPARALHMIEEIAAAGLDRKKHAEIFARYDSRLIED